jgi:hypothetical protein
MTKAEKNSRIIFLAIAVFFCFVTSANGQIPGQPANSRVSGSDWYCVSGYEKVGNQCLSIFRSMGGQPANSRVSGSDWYCVSGYKKSGNACVSIFSSNPATPASASTRSKQTQPAAAAPVCAENNSCYGDISENTGRPKTVYVEGYYRRDGTYVRGHYRSSPRR